MMPECYDKFRSTTNEARAQHSIHKPLSEGCAADICEWPDCLYGRC
jgi:hypothetical protein